MKSRPCPSTPEAGVWRHEKHYRGFLWHLQLQLLAPQRGPYLWFCAFNPEQFLLVPNRGWSWHFLLQDVCSACLPAWENADVPESIFSWIDAERRGGAGGELSGPARRTQPSYWNMSCPPGNRFTSASAESEDKMFYCSFKVSRSKYHHDEDTRITCFHEESLTCFL